MPATALEQKITATKSRNEHEQQSKKLIHEQAKNTKKIHQKSSKNPSKIIQKLSKNPPKIDQNRGLEGVWSDSGSQVRLGTQLGWPRCDFRGQDGPNLGPKMEPKSIKIDSKINQFFSAFWDRIFDEFWSILGAKMEPSWHQNPPKIDAKRQSILGFNFWSIFDRFLVPTSVPENQKIIKKPLVL